MPRHPCNGLDSAGVKLEDEHAWRVADWSAKVVRFSAPAAIRLARTGGDSGTRPLRRASVSSTFKHPALALDRGGDTADDIDRAHGYVEEAD